MFAVGIDLGTTNSAVAILKGRPVIVENDQGLRTLPSAIGWDSENSELVFGVDAKSSPDIYGTTLSGKRLMGSDEKIKVGPHLWTPQQWSAEILKQLKRQVEEKTDEEVTDAVITVPAHFAMAQKQATKEAGELAGLKVQQLLEEPSAAVMAYGPREDEKILVFDLGGGTFDVTIVDCFVGTLKTLAVFGNNYLGGDDFDDRLIEHFKEHLKKESGYTVDPADLEVMANLKKAAEATKITLSRKPGDRVSVPMLSKKDKVGLELLIKREAFNSMIKDLVDSSLKEVEKALEYARLDKTDIDTVLLVGGSTYVPLVQERVAAFFNKPPNKTINPDLAVAIGAAASLVLDNFTTEEAAARHVVTVDAIPEATPEENYELEGRTSPNATVKVTGGAQAVETTADEEGYYSVPVPLKQGMNAFSITSIHPDGRRVELEPEPLIFDENAEVQEAPSPPAPSRLGRPLSISYSISYGNGPGDVISDCTAVIVPGQTDLPKEVCIDNRFSTAMDNQSELMTLVLEGDLPVGMYNCKLSELRLSLPPNVPAGEQVIVRFTVDENAIIQAELECMGRTRQVVINLTATNESPHLLTELEQLFTKIGGKLRPEERAELEQSRIEIEDLAEQGRHLLNGQEFDQIKASMSRFQQAAGKLKGRIDALRRQYL